MKDKLAKIAREKLGGPISKEKQLQLERKRKAMAFLNQIKGKALLPTGLSSSLNSYSSRIEPDIPHLCAVYNDP